MEPKFALVQIGKTTNVFIDGKYITNGIEDLTYHARNENGELCPALELKINVQNFSFDGGIALDQFVETLNRKKKILSEVAKVASSKNTQESD